VLDFDVFVLFEEFLACGNVAAVDINTKDFCVLKAMNNAFQWVTGGCSDIENFFYWLG
jgi:hypothetical protein